MHQLGDQDQVAKEEIGRNSVTPCTMASTMICSKVIAPSPACSPRVQVLYEAPVSRDSFCNA